MKKKFFCIVLLFCANQLVAQQDSINFGMDSAKGYYLSMIRDGVQDTLMLFLFPVEILDCKTNKDSVFYIVKASWGVHYCAQKIKKEKGKAGFRPSPCICRLEAYLLPLGMPNPKYYKRNGKLRNPPKPGTYRLTEDGQKVLYIYKKKKRLIDPKKEQAKALELWNQSDKSSKK
jgi:hypothetical protein